eukprot:CAMPEP_0115240356 /NCGR_PEP_ID=MMETSP0270-20121206/37871_1 /TAXON_ID=71861 /ORGANISM="Scrippsiella trochoidea, Strain CCMP3099" /LENGTH=185 /DNA_ID=CAMNT_0002655341 /DNA_START=546 /DNA_END=1103 /DNA_ORIENTATION=+
MSSAKWARPRPGARVMLADCGLHVAPLAIMIRGAAPDSYVAARVAFEDRKTMAMLLAAMLRGRQCRPTTRRTPQVPWADLLLKSSQAVHTASAIGLMALVAPVHNHFCFRTRVHLILRGTATQSPGKLLMQPIHAELPDRELHDVPPQLPMLGERLADAAMGNWLTACPTMQVIEGHARARPPCR